MPSNQINTYTNSTLTSLGMQGRSTKVKTVPSVPRIHIAEANALTLLRTSGRAFLGGVHLSTCSPGLLVTTCTWKVQSMVQPLEQKLCSMTNGMPTPSKATTNSSCNPRVRKNKQKIYNKWLLFVRDSGPKPHFLQELKFQHPFFYPFTISGIA